jgi:signal transduction histidine kinase
VLASSASLSSVAPWVAVASSLAGYALALRQAGEGASNVSVANVVLLLAAGALAWGHVRHVRALLRFRAAAAAHEIKNSAHSARLLLDEARADANEGASRLLDAASAELQGLSAMAQRLYASSSPSDVRPVRLESVLDDALVLAGPALRAAGVTVEVEPAARAAWLRVDADALRHGLLNLLLNAAEHGPPRGRVRARVVATWHEARIEIDSVGDVPGATRIPANGTPACGGWGIGGRVVGELLAPIGARLELSRLDDGLRATIVAPAVALPWPGRVGRAGADETPEPALATRGAP